MSGQNARKVLNDLRDKEAGIDSIEQQLLMNQDSQNMEMILKELI